jgi:hypothetical protein
VLTCRIVKATHCPELSESKPFERLFNAQAFIPFPPLPLRLLASVKQVEEFVLIGNKIL